MRQASAIMAACMTMAMLGGTAWADPGDRIKKAVDPDCTVGKAARGAAQRATVGVGNRCDAGETARDVLGVDNNGNLKDRTRASDRDGDHDGPLRNRNKN